jgi:uncharacterized protein (DUF1800 family)
MLNRREFHGSLIAALAASVAAPRALGAATPPPDAGEVLLNRLTFGANPASRDALARLGPEAWLEAQLAAPPGDPALDARLAAARLRIAYEAGDNGEGQNWDAVDELRPLASLQADPAKLVMLLDYELAFDYSERTHPAYEVIAASLIRAVHAEAQLREVMTQFWHDHFNVNATKDADTAIFFPAYDAMLRTHALGNFRAMLGETAKSPAMLNYLGNGESHASPANENYARELLELHTLGERNYLNDRYKDWRAVPGAEAGRAEGYIDEDVYETARAFTGWTVGDGRWISEGREAPVTGRFHYAEAWHDPYQKRILGREFPSHQGPMEDGEQVLDLLAAHPGTARFVTGKIARRLLADDPSPDLVEHLAGVFLDASGAEDQVARVIRALVAHPDFAATPPGKLRRPFELLAALYRATGAEIASEEMGWSWQLSRAGWWQHEFRPPTGHPDRAEDWATTTVLARSVDYALYAHEDWFGATKSDLLSLAPESVRTFGDMIAFWNERLYGSEDAPEAGMKSFLFAYGASTADALPEALDDRRHALGMSLAFAALSPAFLYR